MTSERTPNVVVLGGGTGMPVLLRGLKEYPINLATIVTVADDGGSTGRLRETIEIPAPGDIRNTIAALANVDAELEELFQYRFMENENLAGHSLGNIVLAAMSTVTGDFYKGIQKISKLFSVKGEIYPIVNEPAILHAVMEDGTVVTGESKIQLGDKKISRVYLTPEDLKPISEVITAILQADMIVISPGSLYTSILPNLVISEVAQALKTTTAEIIYVCNIMTQNGETNNYTVQDHVKAIHQHIGSDVVDTVIVHNQPIKQEIIDAYSLENAIPVKYNLEALRNFGLDIIEANIVEYDGNSLRHNTALLGEILYNKALESMNKIEGREG